jgi:hypothetical protein
MMLGAALAVALVVLLRPDEGASGAPPERAPQHAAGQSFFSPVGAPADIAVASGRATTLQQLVQHFELVDHTYCSYLAGTTYPQASRPLTEHPDQIYPNAPVAESNPMRSDGGKSDAKVLMQTSQSRVFMAAGEAVAFSVRAVDLEGKTQPLVMQRALAQGITFKDARPSPRITLAFADDGKGADAVSGDGAYAAVLAPGQTGLASFDGTIRTEVRFSVGGRSGLVLFDVIYSPELPATWTGQVREAVEDGSLNYYLAANMRQAGRYIVSGRVDSADGKPFALATFNDMLGTGPNQVKLTVFGKLLHDEKPALPLTLRDVTGYLLKENADPDRALMPRLEGAVFVGKAHPMKKFSDAEWDSEERARHLTEFAKDIGLARQALKQFDATLPEPKSACK